MTMIKYKNGKGKFVEYYIHPDIKTKILDKAKRVVLKENNSFVGVIDGKSGVGKSTFGIQIGCHLDPKFSLDKIAWTPQSFIELIQTAKKGDCIMFDEGMIINSRSAISQMNKAIIIALSQIRSRNIFILININSIFDLDRNISLHRSDVLFHLYTDQDKVDGEKRIKVYGRQKMKYLIIKGKKYYSYSQTPNFFARPPRQYIFLLNEKEYERLKREQTMQNTGFGKGEELVGKREQKYLDRLILLVHWLKTHKEISQREICEAIDVDETDLSKKIVQGYERGLIEKQVPKYKLDRETAKKTSPSL